MAEVFSSGQLTTQLARLKTVRLLLELLLVQERPVLECPVQAYQESSLGLELFVHP